MNNKEAVEFFKSKRHELATIFKDLKLEKSRDVASDSGTSIEGSVEYQRQDIRDVLQSNYKRCQQSLRALEEASKIDSADKAKALESMRYLIYEWEAKSLCLKPFPNKCLYVLITKKLCKLDPGTVLKQVCDGGASVIQLREKEMEDGEFLRWIEKAQEIADPYDIPLIVNDRVHLVQLTGVQGVHMGQGDLDTKDARALLKPWQWLGRSTHELKQAQQAESEGVDYIGVGPLFPTQTKLHREAVGLKYMQEVNEKTNIPYVGIGSVNEETFPEILKYDPRGLAICTGVIASGSPKESTQVFLKQLVK